ncbi:MAG: Ala-tRNA(Pro) hydrolase [Woeseiaceae bacterium]|nr:Ala-tRNA(Pro) hydrolase [Woeseiaceae bacterium]
MTERLYSKDAYLKSYTTEVTANTNRNIILVSTIFYPLGGGQPGDTGTLSWQNFEAKVINTLLNKDGDIEHILSEDSPVPDIGETITARINWDRRYLHMRMHTALHLLGSILPYGVTGGNISETKSRLDFDMEAAVDKESVNKELNKLVLENRNIQSKWITQEVLAQQPELIRTMSVKPPITNQDIRLLEIDGIDLQPCGGTHLRTTGEVGQIALGKVEKKGKHNRRVYIKLSD